MTTPLFDPPAIHELPLSRHSDLYVDFKRKVRVGMTEPPVYEYEDYPAGVEGVLYIDGREPLAIPAEIAGHHAVVWLQSEQTDLIRSGVTWAFKLAYPASPSPIDKVPVNGQVGRYDGKSAL